MRRHISAAAQAHVRVAHNHNTHRHYPQGTGGTVRSRLIQQPQKWFFYCHHPIWFYRVTFVKQGHRETETLSDSTNLSRCRGEHRSFLVHLSSKIDPKKNIFLLLETPALYLLSHTLFLFKRKKQHWGYLQVSRSFLQIKVYLMHLRRQQWFDFCSPKQDCLLTLSYNV